MRKVLFLDRDGTINIDYGYVYKIEDFILVDGILELAKAAKQKGYDIIVITNQSGIERGYYSEADFKKLTEHMRELFEQNGTPLLDVFYCPSLSGNDRKPNPGMFLKAKEKYQIDMENSFSVGDKMSDIEAAYKAGVGHNYLLSSATGENTIRKITDLIAFLK